MVSGSTMSMDDPKNKGTFRSVPRERSRRKLRQRNLCTPGEKHLRAGERFMVARARESCSSRRDFKREYGSVARGEITLTGCGVMFIASSGWRDRSPGSGMLAIIGSNRGFRMPDGSQKML